MLLIQDKPGRLCDSPSRRELLTVGGISLVGLNLPDFLHRQARAEPSGRNGNGFGRARSFIMLYLQGSPSHLDVWDLKPNAPVEIRGEFKPIATKVPGLMVGEHLP